MSPATANFNNRRTYSRLGTRLVATYAMLEKFDESIKAEPVSRESDLGIVLDLGGGGLRLMTERPVPLGTFMRIRLMLPTFPGGRSKLYGSVVALENGGAARKSLARIAFCDILPETQDNIVQYIFNIKARQYYQP